MSLVTALGCNPSSNHLYEKFLALSGSCLLELRKDLISLLSLGRSKNQWVVFLIIGEDLQKTHRGLSISVGSKILPHSSHWSPLALSEPQFGQEPSIIYQEDIDHIPCNRATQPPCWRYIHFLGPFCKILEQNLYGFGSQSAYNYLSQFDISLVVTELNYGIYQLIV